MQYLAAAGIIVVFLAIWVGVDALSRKRGLQKDDGPRASCPGCSCHGEDTCLARTNASMDKKDGS